VVDAANVVCSRPTGWWRDRAGAARKLSQQVASAIRAGHLTPPVVLILEGAARSGVAEGDDEGLRIVHASGPGDDAIVAEVAKGTQNGEQITVVTADRELRERVAQHGADVVRPSWLLDKL
jgi:hypothetical protein